MGEFVAALGARRDLANHSLFQAIIKKEADREILFGELEDWAGKGYYATCTGGLPMPVNLNPA
jgi:hypothetical protein